MTGYNGGNTTGFVSPAGDSLEGPIDLAAILDLRQPSRYPVRVMGDALAGRGILWLFDVSSGMEDVEHGVDGRAEQVDDAREGSGVAIASGASAGCLEQAIERFEAGIGVA